MPRQAFLYFYFLFKKIWANVIALYSNWPHRVRRTQPQKKHKSVSNKKYFYPVSFFILCCNKKVWFERQCAMVSRSGRRLRQDCGRLEHLFSHKVFVQTNKKHGRLEHLFPQSFSSANKNDWFPRCKKIQLVENYLILVFLRFCANIFVWTTFQQTSWIFRADWYF